MGMQLGGGGRFAKLESSFGPGVRNPAALAASIGRKKYGGAKMAGLSHRGTGAAAMPNRPMQSMFGGGK
jgi:hypothetical protein